MALNVLDSTGLARFWAGIKTKLNAKADLVNGQVPDSQLPHTPPQKITDYLYFLDVDWSLDYDAAIAYAEEHSIVSGSACSALRKGNYLGRNLDWLYAETAEFVINTHATKGRHASIGIATGLADLTNTFAQSGVWSDLYEILPFGTTDGINDRGVAVEMNAIDGVSGYNATIDDGNDVTLALAMVPRYVLDYANSADHAVSLLEHVDIIPPFDALPVDVHFMIADKNKTYVVEFVSDGNGGTEMFTAELPDEDDHLPIMTNFYLANYFDDGTYVGGGNGRYDTLEDGYSDVQTKQDMIDLLASVYATVANGTTLGTRNGTQRHTTHSVVYDISEKTMTILPQPDVPEPTGEVFNFAVNNDIISTRSWNDLSDKPFYSNIVPGISISNPDFTDSSAISYNLSLAGSTVPCKTIRMADYVPKERLYGSNLVLHVGSFGDQATEDPIDDSLFADVTDGYMIAADGTPYLFAAATDNASFVMEDGNNNTIFSVTLPTSGVYFCYIDGTDIPGLDDIFYIKSLTKAGTYDVKQLDPQFYNAPFIVNGTLNLQNMTVSGLDKTYAQILEAFNANRIIKLKLTYYTSQSTYEVCEGDGRRMQSGGGFFFDTMIYGDLGAGAQLLYLALGLTSGGSTSVTVKRIDTPSATGVSF